MTWQDGCWSAGKIVSTAVDMTAIRQQHTHIYCPNACPCANIERVSWILHRRKVELAGEGQAQHVVLQVQSIRFALHTVRTSLQDADYATRLTSSFGKMYLPSL